jgi:UDP-glucose 4-epimerase
MRVLVTGGAGFIGSNLVKLLTESGHDIVVLDNYASGHRQNLDPFPHAQVITADVRDGAAVHRAMGGCEAVFHLAASVGNVRSIEHPIDDSQINMLGTLNILESARQLGVRKVVFSSSAGIFGELKTVPIREDHPAEPDTPYGASKLGAEKMCLAYAKLYPLECVCLRYFNVYGVNQRYDAYGNVIPIFAHRALRGQPLVIYGDGEQTRDFINVRDVAMANYRAAITRGVSGAFNIASGSRVTINALVSMLTAAGDLNVATEHAAPRKGDVRHSLADISAARAAFGFDPAVALEPGLQEYMTWAREAMV